MNVCEIFVCQHYYYHHHHRSSCFASAEFPLQCAAVRSVYIHASCWHTYTEAANIHSILLVRLYGCVLLFNGIVKWYTHTIEWEIV